MSESSIGVSRKLKADLGRLKLHPRETYEEVIWRIIGESLTKHLEATE